MILAKVLVLVMCAAATASLEGERELTDYSFADFISEFEKEYSESDNAMRETIFLQNMKTVVGQNAKPDKNWFATVNRFTDWTHEEYKNYYHSKKSASVGTTKAQLLQGDQDLPDNVDWRETDGVVTAVKNQGGCGSCWAFSATESLESHYAINMNATAPVLSPQQITSCTPNPDKCGGTGGCSGSTESQAFTYTQTAGVTTEKDYPYKAQTGTCQTDKIKPVAKNAGFVELTPNSYSELMTAVATLGPVSIGVAAEAWQFYGGGVFDDDCGYDMDHGVNLVGYGIDGDSKYWLVRNSWGGSWGEAGYIRLVRYGDGKETCGMDTTPGDGDACAGDNKPRKYCGQCAILSSSSYPTDVSNP